MGNLLIGVLAMVMFFTGIVYGAISLGPKIEEGRTAGASAKLLGEMTSAANALNQYRVGTNVWAGSQLGDLSNLVTGGFLAGLPVNPTSAGILAEPADEAGLAYSQYVSGGMTTSSFVPKFIVMGFGEDRTACSWFARQSSYIEKGADVSVTPRLITDEGMARAGCFRSQNAIGAAAAGSYVAFVRL